MIQIGDYFQSTRDRVASLAQEFGVANCRGLILVQRQSGGPTTYIQVEPRPIIQSVNPRLVAIYQGIEGIQIELEDLQCQVSKRYTRDEIVGSGISYLIDAEMVNGQPVGGFAADKVSGVELREKDLHWELILRRRRS